MDAVCCVGIGHDPTIRRTPTNVRLDYGFSAFFCESLYSRRCKAESNRLFSSSVSGTTGATGTRSLFGPRATKVRYADDVWRRTPVLSPDPNLDTDFH